MTVYLGISGGFGVGLVLAYLFETRSPRRGVHKLLTAILLKSAEFLRTLDDPSHPSTERASLSAAYRKQSLRRLQQLKQLSALANDVHDFHAARDQIQSVLRAVDVLVMRLGWSDSVGALRPLEDEGLKRARAWCVESLTRTGQTLDALQLTALPQPAIGPIEELSISNGSKHPDDAGAAFAAYYRSVADAIGDCHNKLSSVDWKRWCGNQF